MGFVKTTLWLCMAAVLVAGCAGPEPSGAGDVRSSEPSVTPALGEQRPPEVPASERVVQPDRKKPDYEVREESEKYFLVVSWWEKGEEFSHSLPLPSHDKEREYSIGEFLGDLCLEVRWTKPTGYSHLILSQDVPPDLFLLRQKIDSLERFIRRNWESGDSRGAAQMPFGTSHFGPWR